MRQEVSGALGHGDSCAEHVLGDGSGSPGWVRPRAAGFPDHMGTGRARHPHAHEGVRDRQCRHLRQRSR